MHGFFNPIFTNAMHPWHVGVLWDCDPRMAVSVMETFDGRCGFWIGGDPPRSARHHDTDAVDAHAAPVELPGLAMEIRHDLIETPEGAELWSGPMGDVLAEILAAPHL
jgi:predicted N-formylglutamate amidohydrolase